MRHFVTRVFEVNNDKWTGYGDGEKRKDGGLYVTSDEAEDVLPGTFTSMASSLTVSGGLSPAGG
jgi:hypothetical protein